MNESERRIAQRVPALYKVSFIHDGDYLISHSKDISIDGMFLHTEKPPNIGAITTLTFSIGHLEDLEISAEVVWVNKKGAAKDSGMAVKFIDPPSQLQDIILKVVNKVAVLS